MPQARNATPCGCGGQTHHPEPTVQNRSINAQVFAWPSMVKIPRNEHGSGACGCLGACGNQQDTSTRTSQKVMPKARRKQSATRMGATCRHWAPREHAKRATLPASQRQRRAVHIPATTTTQRRRRAMQCGPPGRFWHPHRRPQGSKTDEPHH